MEQTTTIQDKATVSVNWENDGMLEISNAKTLDTYNRLCDEWYHRETPYIFYAFNKNKFAEGIKKLEKSGWKNDGEKLIDVGYGGFTTRRGYERMTEEVDEHHRKIREQCDIKEVYWYEYNNHESFISWDGDMNAIQKIAAIWGEEEARKLHRFSPVYTLDEIFGKKEVANA